MLNKTIKEFAKAYASKIAQEKICKALRDNFIAEGEGVYRFAENQKTYIVEVKKTSPRRYQNVDKLKALLDKYGVPESEWESTFERKGDGVYTVTGDVATK